MGFDRVQNMILWVCLLQVGDGCGSIGAVITILQNDAANGTITNDQADSVLGWLYYFRDIVGC